MSPPCMGRNRAGSSLTAGWFFSCFRTVPKSDMTGNPLADLVAFCRGRENRASLPRVRTRRDSHTRLSAASQSRSATTAVRLRPCAGINLKPVVHVKPYIHHVYRCLLQLQAFQIQSYLIHFNKQQTTANQSRICVDTTQKHAQSHPKQKTLWGLLGEKKFQSSLESDRWTLHLCPRKQNSVMDKRNIRITMETKFPPYKTLSPGSAFKNYNHNNTWYSIS